MDALPKEFRDPLVTLRDMDWVGVKTIRSEYTRLSRGPTNQLSPDPPYESLYRENTIYGSTTTNTRKSYLQTGLDLTDEEDREPLDLLGIELQFLGELRSREAEGDEESRPQLQAFLEEHVAHWFDDFEAAIQENEPHEFSEAIVRLTGALLGNEAVRLDVDWQRG
ncbi:TorD/DmsD family molecular chaperone [Halodesulfurarchaeum sp.]|uniref:TorD/DmsD family molecular chaperone n=1 Tax=Halodesulfurarchaeum sp. TaxID=1980530 RepID=UPI001BBC5069|nr:molecular chaperone TorD family protein [Halodesulfurarchaeum sp.]